MEHAISTGDSNCEVVFSGTITYSDHNRFRDLLASIAASRCSRVVFHLAKVSFMDSAALGMMLLALDEAKHAGRSLVLNGASGRVRRLFDMARFDTMFTMT